MVVALVEDCSAGCHDLRLLCLSRIADSMYVDDMKLFQKGPLVIYLREHGNCTNFAKLEMEKVHLGWSVTEGDKEGSSKLEVSNSHLKQRLKGFVVKRRVRNG